MKMPKTRNYGSTEAHSLPPERVRGKDYLLAIGIDEYENVSRLNNCVLDTKTFVKVMSKQYGYAKDHIFELYNKEATRSEISKIFGHLAKTIQGEDSLLIYFAGHGLYNSSSEVGFLVPVDGEEGEQHTLIYNSVIRDDIRGIKAHHVFLIVDSCYSGALILQERDIKLQLGAAEIEAHALQADQRRSRWGLSSGAIEKVPDGLCGRHSPFNKKLIEFLEKPFADTFGVSEVVRYVKNVVSYGSQQKPQGGILYESGHEGGEFIFRRTGYRRQGLEKGYAEVKEVAAWKIATEENSVEEYQAYLKGFPEGIFIKVAQSRIDRLVGSSAQRKERVRRRELEVILDEARALTKAGSQEDAFELFEDALQIANEKEKAAITEEMEIVFSLEKGNNNFENSILETLGIEMIRVEGGEFLLGNEIQCNLSDFEIGRYPITQTQWEKIMGSNPSVFNGCANCPVEKVSWKDAQTFIQEINRQSGDRFCLPTEAQWEFAARGGTHSKGFIYAGSDELEEVAWFKENAQKATHPVGALQPNELGIFDLLGNVAEWCQDWFNPFPPSPLDNPQGPSTGQGKIIRGGSWYNSKSYCSITNRSSTFPDNRSNYIGFRLAKTLCERNDYEGGNGG